MSKNNTKEIWLKYKKEELEKLEPILKNLGYALDEEQVHINGERHLMSGFKLVLNGRIEKTNQRIIIKASSHKDGIKEIEREHNAREITNNIKFAYYNFLLPKEILFKKINGFTISVTIFIEQNKPFLEHSLEDQFFLVLRSLETQEGTHITTSSHAKEINKFFGIRKAEDYLKSMELFLNNSVEKNSENYALKEIFNKAFDFFKNNINVIEEYSNFLTHSDFVPHNIRVVDHDIYLLDHTSIRFGNKHESWARLINYMTIYNRELETALVYYIKNNREADEYLSLRLMRTYIIAFLLNFYSNSLSKTKDNLYELTKKRLAFWTSALEAILNDELLEKNIIEKYKRDRDTLRSEEEKMRQKSLNQLF